MAVHKVAGVEQPFDHGYRQRDSDPVPCRAEGQLPRLDPVVCKPGLDEVDGGIQWPDQLMDLFGREMLPESWVRRAGDYKTGEMATTARQS